MPANHRYRLVLVTLVNADNLESIGLDQLKKIESNIAT